MTTASNAMLYDQLLDRIILDGLAEVRKAYAAPKEHHKRDGAIEGFEACRGKSPFDLVVLWAAAEKIAAQIANARSSLEEMSVTNYWRQRYKVLQIEWVCNVISVGLMNSGQPPLLGHLPTARAAMKYASIVGLRAQELS